MIVCGGIGADERLHGQTAAVITTSGEGFGVANFVSPSNDNECMPFMIGSSVVQVDDSLLVFGGGATCFSMGTFWETGIYKIWLPDSISQSTHSGFRLYRPIKSTIDLIGCRKFLATPTTTASDDEVGGAHCRNQDIIMTPVPRIQLESPEQFHKILRDGKPVIFKSCDIGQCQSKWSADFLVNKIGESEKVSQYKLQKVQRSKVNSQANCSSLSYTRAVRILEHWILTAKILHM